MEIRKYIRKQWIKTTLSAAESVPLLFIKDWDKLKITYHFQSPCTHLQTTRPFLKQISVSYKLVNYYFKVHVTSHITWLKQISLLPLQQTKCLFALIKKKLTQVLTTVYS